MEVTDILNNLSIKDRERLYTQLNKEFGIDSSAINIISEINTDKKITCPHCESSNIYGHGSYKGRKRYNCQECNKTFNDYTGTAISGIHDVEKFEKFIKMSVESPTIRKVASTLKINIKTSFDWRHKLLSSISKTNGNRFEGIVECDDKQLDINEKGRRNLKRKAYKRPSDRKKKRGVSNDKVSIMVATDRENNPTMKFAKIGRIDEDSVNNTIGDFIELENVLCSDSHPSIKLWAKNKGLEHHTFIASKQHVKNKCYHVQHVNSLDNLYERWVNRFCGVSTKYLPQYLNWFVLMRKIKDSLNPVKDIVKVLLNEHNTIAIFREIENNYLKLNIQQSYKT
jgi:transposase-like protein